MKKMLTFALALSATALMAYPMGQGMMPGDYDGPMGPGMMQEGNSPMGPGMMGGGYGCQGGWMEKSQYDAKRLPRTLEALELSAKQKEDIIKLREEEQAFHNKQREKMMGILTPEQRSKVEYMQKLRKQRWDNK